MSYYHLLSATHLYVFVAICPTAVPHVSSLSVDYLIELLVWLLNCCVVIKLTKKLH